MMFFCSEIANSKLTLEQKGLYLCYEAARMATSGDAKRIAEILRAQTGLSEGEINALLQPALEIIEAAKKDLPF